MPTTRFTTAIALLISSATVATLAAPGFAGEGAPSGSDVPLTALANTAPVAEDDSATVTAGGSIVIAVLDNDSDPDGSSSTVLSLVGVVDQPTSGSAVVDASSIEYTPAAGFVGVDTFTYEISDGELTDQATVTVTVSAAPNDPPVTVADAARTRWELPLVVDVAANDSDPDGDALTVVDVNRPDHGRAEVVKGKVRYTPTGEYLGPATMTYSVQDARGATATGQLVVDVNPRFTVEVRRVSKAIARHSFTVHGVVSTRLDGPVSVALQRRKEGRWRTIADRRVRGEDRFEVRWKSDQPGRVTLRLAARWDGAHADQSPRKRVRIEARFEPVVSRVRARDVPHTWRPGCPVGPSGLRAIRMNYWDYRGRLQRGTLIGASWVTDDYIAVFRRAFETKFKIKKMFPADRYGGVDERAMRAGNTSAFNCRHVTGNPYRMSQHSYGNAIDINTFENPYVTGSRVYPAKAAIPYYYHRERNLRDPGVITARSSIARALWGRGWAWGARWSAPDYQHWSSNGG